jgi:MFS family permease
MSQSMHHAIAAFLPTRSLGQFYAVAAVFGFAYGGVMPLYAVLARDYFGPRIMGTVFGAFIFPPLPALQPERLQSV